MSETKPKYTFERYVKEQSFSALSQDQVKTITDFTTKLFIDKGASIDEAEVASLLEDILEAHEQKIADAIERGTRVELPHPSIEGDETLMEFLDEIRAMAEMDDERAWSIINDGVNGAISTKLS